MLGRASDARTKHNRLALHFCRRGRSLVISPYPKIDISWLITSISEAWKRSSLFIARRPGICERRGRPGGEGAEGRGRECRNHRRRLPIFFPQTLASCRFVHSCRQVYVRNVNRKERDWSRRSIQFHLAYRSWGWESVVKKKEKERQRERERRQSRTRHSCWSKPRVRSIVTFPKRSEERRCSRFQ